MLKYLTKANRDAVVLYSKNHEGLNFLSIGRYNKVCICAYVTCSKCVIHSMHSCNVM